MFRIKLIEIAVIHWKGLPFILGSEDESSKVDPDSLGQKLTDSAKKKDKKKKNKKNKAVIENEDCKNPETFSSSEKTSKSENPIKFHKNKVKESLSKDSKEVGHILSFMHVIKVKKLRNVPFPLPQNS